MMGENEWRWSTISTVAYIKLLVVLYTSPKCVISCIQFTARCESCSEIMMRGDSMKSFVKDFLEALVTCVQLGIAVPILLAALFGPTALIILAILWALGII